jgi:hypothetical protein
MTPGNTGDRFLSQMYRCRRAGVQAHTGGVVAASLALKGTVRLKEDSGPGAGAADTFPSPAPAPTSGV